MLAYSYQQNVFPIFTELKNKNNVEYDKVQITGLGLTSLIYLAVGLICIFMFGPTLTEYSSVLDNIGSVKTVPGGGVFWEAIIV